MRSLEITGVRPLQLDWSPLEKTLAARADQFLIGGSPYNPYRKAEDGRRIVAFWQSNGYFDVTIADSKVAFDDAENAADILWVVDEGPAYAIRKVEVREAPAGWEARLAAEIPFKAGAPVRVDPYRWVRHAMENDLRRAGWMRAEVYSRAFVDRGAKAVDWYYYVDTGPKSVVGTVTVEGNRNVPAALIIARSGLRPGDPLDLDTIAKKELDLLDMGAFDTARIFADFGTEFVTNAVPPDSWIPPDTGGVIKPEQIGPDGEFIPRQGLSPEIDVTLVVSEFPSTQARVDFGVSADLERVDPEAGFDLQLRNAFGPLHHLVVAGRVGYDIRWRGDEDEPTGLFGAAKVQYLTPGFLARLLDFRVTAELEEELYPGFHWRTAAAGFGFFSLLAKGLALDIEPRFRADWAVGVGTLDPAVAAALDVRNVERTLTGELRVALIADGRDNTFEPMQGGFVALRGSWGALGDAPWLRAGLDLRYLIRFGLDVSLGFRAAGTWMVALDAAAGIPIGARLFGGGAYGVRGFGTRRLAPYANACRSDGHCQDIPVGATSLFEGSAELRWLPFRKQFGATVFFDVGGASVEPNPFDAGVSAAVGVGLRVRTWHIPLALDFAYRVTDVAAYSDLDRFLVFARIGEAF